MKKKSHPPRFLTEVLQAIYELKETGGSRSNKIVSHVKSNLKHINSYSTPRNLSTQVRRALKHATTNGIVRQRAGKFRLNKNIQDPFKDCAECRRKKRKARLAKRRPRRSRKNALKSKIKSCHGQRSDSESLKFGSDSESPDEFPFRELKRRRRKGKKGKRRNRKRRSGIKKQIPVINKNSAMKVESVYPDDHKESNNKNNNNNECNNVQCDNPDCLCNVKEELEDNQSFDSPM